MIWIIGHYADRIDNADELLSSFLDSFLDEPADVQLSLLTAVVKLFLHRPNSAEELIKKGMTSVSLFSPRTRSLKLNFVKKNSLQVGDRIR